ncbi:hypothetical protein NA57DRAFT_78177 [Rhizodiscina lignyota]|uniref:Uncharacterized protein n=1 Tax=Rhizodiscina lignyota TaxID=1504668 RepID=A0A9P4IDJ1_9PEZI|nr:hypothetical protein NA57DRAFT_78177 [Rhizodiscina lignyota]
MADVLEIAKLVQDRNKNSENTRTCMRVIRNCFKATAKHRSTLENILSCVPNDIYGSIIAGGFTVVLAVICDHEKLRNDMQASLAEIPRRLSTVQRLTEVHVKSKGLHVHANSVFICIFIALERIIDSLSMNFGESMLSKVKGRSGDIKDALGSLNRSIAEFKEEVEICAQVRMGRIEENGMQIRHEMRAGITEMTQMRSAIARIEENQRKFLNGEQQTIFERAQAAVWNEFYRLVASDPTFNPIDGTVIQDRLKYILTSNRSAIAPSGGALFSVDTNRRIIDEWIDGLAPFDPEVSKDLGECSNAVETLDLEEKDKIRWIMNSGELYEWFTRSSSCVLEVEAESPPDKLINSLSFTTGLLVKMLSNNTELPVLSFFCGLRANSSREEDESGPIAMLKSMNGQLLRFLTDQRPTIDLSFLKEAEYSQKSQEKIKYALALFKRLLGMLPENDGVFILLDSFSRISGNLDEGNRVVERIIKMIDETPNAIIKLLVTDCMSDCPVKDLAHLSLRVPDHVDGGKFGLNLEALERENNSLLLDVPGQGQKAASSSNEDEDDDDW